MTKTVKVRVLRPMIGDKRYERGDTRELDADVAERFADTGAVEILSDSEKKKPKKKAARPARKKSAK